MFKKFESLDYRIRKTNIIIEVYQTNFGKQKYNIFIEQVRYNESVQ